MHLRYIIDYSEKDFADRLKKEINSDASLELKITREFLEKYAKTKHINVSDFLRDIISKRYIDPIDFSVIEEFNEKFKEDYSDLFKALENGKVVDINKNKNKNVELVNICESNFRKLEKLWKLINQKYYLHFEKLTNDELKNAVLDIVKLDIDGRTTLTTKISRTRKVTDDGSVNFEDELIRYTGTAKVVKVPEGITTIVREMAKKLE